MKRISIFLLAVFAMTAVTTKAEVLLVEDFDYESGMTLMAANAEWKHQWPNHDNTMIITDGGLTFAGYAGSGVGNALLIEGETSNDEPYHAFKEVKEGDVFVAVLVQPMYIVARGYMLTLRDNEIDATTFHQNGRICFSTDNEGNPIVGTRQDKKTSEVYATGTPLDETKIYLIVLRYHIVPGSKNDEVSLYLFDEMPKVMPDKPLIGPLNSSAVETDIYPSNIFLHTWNSDSFGDVGQVVMDGLRVATSFYEAIGIDEPTGVEDVKMSEVKEYKLQVRNGQLVITNGGKIFNMLGASVQ